MTEQQRHWVAQGDTLRGNAHEDQDWNVAVLDGELGDLVALAFGYSPEGVRRRATLIAAAPELLRALRELREACNMRDREPSLAAADRYTEALFGARDALAKVEGLNAA